MTFTVDVICSWCRCKMGVRSGYSSPDATHGICWRCRDSISPTPTDVELRKAAPSHSTHFPFSPGGGGGHFHDGTAYREDGLTEADGERADLLVHIAVLALACAALFLLGRWVVGLVFG